MNIECSGSGALVFIGNALNYVKGQICIGGCAVCYIDEKNYFGEVFMRIFEGRNIIIGRECLFSNDASFAAIFIIQSNRYARFTTYTTNPSLYNGRYNYSYLKITVS